LRLLGNERIAIQISDTHPIQCKYLFVD
jgi:hypothetical protein